MNCSHIKASSFRPEVVLKAMINLPEDPILASCLSCTSLTDPESRWIWFQQNLLTISLFCGLIHCGRSCQAHAEKHYISQKSHCLVMDLETKAVHCYVCNDYVNDCGNFENDMISLRSKISDLLAGLLSSSGEDLPLESTSLPAEKVKITIKRRPFQGKYSHITGLFNLGNTCFMNVVLVIFHFNYYVASAVSYHSNARLFLTTWINSSTNSDS